MQIGTIKPVEIEEEMKSSYLDYAMSVIISRALPDIRDGLKPVQRRILYAMEELGLRHNAAYKKSARIVGEVLGKYHPHGDSPVYEAMVRMAQDFTMRYPLIDGQGNFGSVDNDPPAAMRYTEARLADIAAEILTDIDRDTVDFTPNFDDSLKEPSVLPAKLPNLLLNGASGIAVGMATNIPPHNLGEIADAICHLVDNPEASFEELASLVRGPDFPTAGEIHGRQGILNAYATGRGRIVVRAKADIEEIAKGRSLIVVTELPYQTNKAALVERIADLAKSKKIEGIADLRDESDRQGMRIVIELKRDAHPEWVLNNLFHHTAMQSAFFVNMLALVDGQPRVLSLKTALQQYIRFRQEIIVRRSRFEMRRARERAHILEGLKIALDNLDAVIATIRRSQSAEAARNNLMTSFNLSQPQAQAILDMQLRRLAALERQKINDEYAEVLKTIAYLEDLLASPAKILSVVKDDVTELKRKHGDTRRTVIFEEEATDPKETDLIPHRQVVLTLSNRGYIKRMPSEVYRVQMRGGRGITGTRETEGVHRLRTADTHDTVLFFTNVGKLYALKCYHLPEDTSRISKGTPLVKFLPLSEKEQVIEMLPISSFTSESFVLMATRSGQIKKTALAKFATVRSNGLIANKVRKGDELIGVAIAPPDGDVIVVTRKGHAIRFSVADLRAASRSSGGVRAVRMEPDDRVVSIDAAFPDACLLVVTENGFGKCTLLERYRHQSRGGKGLRTMSISQKSGPLAAGRTIQPTDELIILSRLGVVIRLKADSIPVQGRVRKGAILMRLDEGDAVASVAVLRQPLA